ncbi:tripartite motif-containing protein 26-like, partial [Neopelma chrysocephalum]|uniref:tripartite motif-containing protein 26-like n=1 Tax=Neopelma chrysocephalum TaxID=114329 RepID=UPI000FCCEF54
VLVIPDGFLVVPEGFWWFYFIPRCGKVTFQLPLDAAPGSEERICHFSWRSNALKETLRKLQAPVTLDPATAHPELVLSEDFKSVRRGGAGPARNLPDTPERFDYWPFVLGQPGFSSGRHCWAVDVGDGGDWALGVARDSLPREKIQGRLDLLRKERQELLEFKVNDDKRTQELLASSGSGSGRGVSPDGDPWVGSGSGSGMESGTGAEGSKDEEEEEQTRILKVCFYSNSFNMGKNFKLVKCAVSTEIR